MTDRNHAFDARLERVARTEGERAVRAIDALAIAASAVSADVPRAPSPWRVAAVVAAMLLIVLVFASAIYVGSQRQDPRLAIAPGPSPGLQTTPSALAPSRCSAMSAVVGARRGAMPSAVDRPVASGSRNPGAGVIAYVDETGGISTWDPATGVVEPLVSLVTPDMRILGPVWSSDGARLAFAVLSGPNGLEACGDVIVVNADGTGMSALTMSSATESFNPVAWSPDGEAIMLGHSWVDSAIYRSESLIASTDGSSSRVVEDGVCDGAGDMRWSPAGTRIAAAEYGAGIACLWDADGGGPERLLPEGLPAPSHWYHDTMRWSSDGQSILQFAQDADGRDWLYRIPASGSGDGDRISVISAGAGSAVLSPDGTRYLMAVEHEADGSTYDLAVAALDGSDPIRIAEALRSPFATWSPDGMSILYADDTVIRVHPLEGGQVSIEGPAGTSAAWQPQP